jgi:two-component system phosphate regulon response regulator PhoB
MSGEHILIVEDEKDIRNLLRFNLEKQDYRVTALAEGDRVIKELRKSRPDLILLDLMLPGVSGKELCRTIKADSHMQSIPIIMVTAKTEEADIVTGLEAGADDYITKPFSLNVLRARVKSVLRRHASETKREDEVIDHQGLRIHPGRHEVTVNGEPINLTYTEFKVLHCLARRPGWVFTRYQIVDAVRGQEYEVTDRAVDVTIVGLRKKLGSAAKMIQTVRGVGYKFKENG